MATAPAGSETSADGESPTGGDAVPAGADAALPPEKLPAIREASPLPEELVGTYKIVDPGNPNPKPFTLILAQPDSDTCTWITNGEAPCYTLAHRTVFEKGGLEVQGGTMFIAAAPGSYGDCPADVYGERASYEWSIDGDGLSLSAPDDPCTDRALLMALGPWTIE